MNGELWTWGSNSHGQLGVEDFTGEESAIPLKAPLPGGTAAVLDAVLGGGHTLIPLNNGSLLGAGRNEYGQLGLEKLSKILSWTLIPVDSLLGGSSYQVSAGWDFTYVYTAKTVAVAGSNLHSQIALDKGIQKTRIFTPIDLSFLRDARMKGISCGLRHTLFLDSRGNVYGVGSNRKGQLGLTNKGSILVSPSPVVMDRNVAQISAGQNFSLCLSEDGSVFGFGDNKFGQLNIPVMESPLLRIDCGWTHCLGLQSSRHILAWGRNTYGQTTGNGLGPCKDVSSGSEHALAIYQNRLVSWGWNEHGNCGNGSTSNVLEPATVEWNFKGRDIVFFRAGPGHSLAYVVDLGHA
uniref:Secretion-regulating guanine nucleotide exchange factor n=1 Tax=Caligus clemensi TaxID=344056 RepID=C1C0W5_CALCM|nr:Secretion-regulating guanine nucleotide exchange factor [Caligus clemensi]